MKDIWHCGKIPTNRCVYLTSQSTIDTYIFLYAVSSWSPLFAIWSYLGCFATVLYPGFCAETGNDSVFVRTLTIGGLIKWRAIFAAARKHAILCFVAHVFSTFIRPSYQFIMQDWFMNLNSHLFLQFLL